MLWVTLAKKSDSIYKWDLDYWFKIIAETFFLDEPTSISLMLISHSVEIHNKAFKYLQKLLISLCCFTATRAFVVILAIEFGDRIESATSHSPCPGSIRSFSIWLDLRNPLAELSAKGHSRTSHGLARYAYFNCTFTTSHCTNTAGQINCTSWNGVFH